MDLAGHKGTPCSLGVMLQQLGVLTDVREADNDLKIEMIASTLVYNMGVCSY